MKVAIVDLKMKIKVLGNTPEIVIPRVGENINVGYNPYPKVKGVTYDYEENLVYIVIDGYLFQ